MLPLPAVDSTCRLCLASVDTEFASSIQPYIGTLCGMALFSLDDRMPQKICRNCVVQVQNAESLRRKVFAVESLWSRCVVTGLGDTAQVLLYCHVCGCQCPYQSLGDHVATHHGRDHMEGCRLCQVVGDFTCQELSPPSQEQQGIQIISVRGGMANEEEPLHSFVDLNPRIKVERIEVDDQLNDNGETTDVDYEPSDQEESDEDVTGALDSGGEASAENKKKHKPRRKRNKSQADKHCPLCTSAFFQTVDLRRHLKKFHPKKMVCTKCFKILESKKYLLAHEPKCRNIKCYICKAHFENTHQYQRHLDTVHDKESYMCCYDGCDRVFPNRQSGMRHESLHSAVKRFKCHFKGCASAFHEKSNLNRHVRYKHTGERPFACQYCKKRFCASCERNSHEKKCGNNT